MGLCERRHCWHGEWDADCLKPIPFQAARLRCCRCGVFHEDGVSTKGDARAHPSGPLTATQNADGKLHCPEHGR